MPHPHRRRLGQHFLADPHYRLRIADAIGLRNDDLVIEIGAGRGAMTGLLAERAQCVVAIELDPELAARLNQLFGSDKRVHILHSDILSTDVNSICKSYGASRCFVFGNVPYYITSPILEHLAKHQASIRALALLVQREVAERIVASPGTRDYGYLSVFVQVFSRPRLLFKVPPGAFAPPPKVQSALVMAPVEPRFPQWSPAKQVRFLGFVKSCFAQKRKKIINNLASIAGRPQIEQELERRQLPATARAEQLSIEQLAGLFEGLSEGARRL